MDTKDKKITVEIPLANGCTLYRRPNEVGGFVYSSDEIGCGVHVWDTALVDHRTLLTAMVDYHTLMYR